MQSYETSALCFIFTFERVFPSSNCRVLLQKVLSYLHGRHCRFEVVNNDILKEHVNMEEGNRMVDLMKHNAEKGLYVSVIVTVKGLVNMDEDEISIEVVERLDGGWPMIGLTGPEGEYGAIIGLNDSSSPWKSRYGDQGVRMDMDRRLLLNKGEFDNSLDHPNAIKKGDVIRMVVKNHTLTYYHNNVRIGPFKDFNPIRLLKNRGYKFAVGLWRKASVRLLK